MGAKNLLMKQGERRRMEHFKPYQRTLVNDLHKRDLGFDLLISKSKI